MTGFARIDPTADLVIGRDTGRQFDTELRQLGDLAFKVLYESSNGLSVRQISRQMRLPEMVVAFLLDPARVRRWLSEQGISPSDGDNLRSAMVHELDELSAPRCRNAGCNKILRQALEPRRRGRPAVYCDAECRAAGPATPQPRSAVGFIGTCAIYPHGCKCAKVERWPAEHKILLIPLTDSRYSILFDGLRVGDIFTEQFDPPTKTTFMASAMIRVEVDDNPDNPDATLNRKLRANSVVLQDLGYIAIRMLASTVERAPVASVVIPAPGTALELARAKGFGYKRLKVLRPLPSLSPPAWVPNILEPSDLMMWKCRPSPSHIVA